MEVVLLNNLNKEKQILQLIQHCLLMYKHSQKYYNFEEICKLYNITEEELIIYIDEINKMSNLNIPITYQDNKPKICHQKKEYKIHEFEIPKKQFKLCFVSDKHIGHIDDRLKYVNNVYEEAEKNNIDLVFDLGDLLNGPMEMAKNPLNVRISNLTDSIKETNLFHQSTIPTHFITGNHDLGFMETDYSDIGKLIEKECKNLFFINNLFAPIEVNGLRINLSHGYIEQKHLRNIKLYKEYKFLTVNNPHLILQGHFHLNNLTEQKDTILYQIPSLKYKEGMENNNNINGCGYSIGAIFLTVDCFEDYFEMRFDEIEFIEKKVITQTAEYAKKR